MVASNNNQNFENVFTAGIMIECVFVLLRGLTSGGYVPTICGYVPSGRYVPMYLLSPTHDVGSQIPARSVALRYLIPPRVTGAVIECPETGTVGDGTCYKRMEEDVVVPGHTGARFRSP